LPPWKTCFGIESRATTSPMSALSRTLNSPWLRRLFPHARLASSIRCRNGLLEDRRQQQALGVAGSVTATEMA
jgi:hypothetical protein